MRISKLARIYPQLYNVPNLDNIFLTHLKTLTSAKAFVLRVVNATPKYYSHKVLIIDRNLLYI